VLGAQQPGGAGDHPCRLGGADGGLVGAHELAGEGAAALGARHDVGVVGQRAAMAASGALLLGSVDLGLGRVQIERHALSHVAPGLTVKALADACLRALDRADLTWPQVARQLTRRRRRRRRGDRAQRCARTVGADVLDVVKALRPGDLALRQRDRERARRKAPPPPLDRPLRADRAELGVDQLDQPRASCQLTDDRQTRIRRQGPIIAADHEPSGSPVIVIGVHPQGDAPSPSAFVLIPRTLTVQADGKPRICGAFPISTRPLRRSRTDALSALPNDLGQKARRVIEVQGSVSALLGELLDPGRAASTKRDRADNELTTITCSAPARPTAISEATTPARDPARPTKRLVSKLEALGHTVTLQPDVA
jgi:hypothetical protein